MRPLNKGRRSQARSLTHTGLPHGVRLPGARLTIGKHGDIEAFKESLKEGLHTGLVHSLLPSVLIQHHVEAEVAVSAQGDPAVLWLHPQAALVPVQQLLGKEWADSQGHPHRGLLGPWQPLGLQPHVERLLLPALRRDEEALVISIWIHLAGDLEPVPAAPDLGVIKREGGQNSKHPLCPDLMP